MGVDVAVEIGDESSDAVCSGSAGSMPHWSGIHVSAVRVFGCTWIPNSHKTFNG